MQKNDSIDHLEITSDIDTESSVKLAGTRFAVLKDDIAKLEEDLEKDSQLRHAVSLLSGWDVMVNTFKDKLKTKIFYE